MHKNLLPVVSNYYLTDNIELSAGLYSNGHDVKFLPKDLFAKGCFRDNKFLFHEMFALLVCC